MQERVSWMASMLLGSVMVLKRIVSGLEPIASASVAICSKITRNYWPRRNKKIIAPLVIARHSVSSREGRRKLVKGICRDVRDLISIRGGLVVSASTLTKNIALSVCTSAQRADAIIFNLISVVSLVIGSSKRMWHFGRRRRKDKWLGSEPENRICLLPTTQIYRWRWW